MQKQDIYSAYKPLRNVLCDVNVYESLYVIWAYANHLQQKNNFPSDVEVDSSYRLQPDYVQKSRIIAAWNLELLAHEILVCGNSVYPQIKTLLKWSTMAGVANKLKDIEKHIAENYVKQENVLSELERSVHRQLPWQIGFHPRLLTKLKFHRYCLCSDPKDRANQIIINGFM